MKNFNVKLYKNGKYKDICYHVNNIVYDEDWNEIRIYSWGLITRLNHPEKWKLVIEKEDS